MFKVIIMWIVLSFSALLSTRRARFCKTELPLETVLNKYKEGVFFLDVRTQGEWDNHHLEYATHIPFSDISYRFDEIPMDEDVIVICRSGAKSMMTVKILQKKGYNKIYSLVGGITPWFRKGFPTV